MNLTLTSEFDLVGYDVTITSSKNREIIELMVKLSWKQRT